PLARGKRVLRVRMNAHARAIRVGRANCRKIPLRMLVKPCATHGRAQDPRYPVPFLLLACLALGVGVRYHTAWTDFQTAITPRSRNSARAENGGVGTISPRLSENVSHDFVHPLRRGVIELLKSVQGVWYLVS
ncbi:unnamed protein product, partial [Ectocarpus sp. 12 AP-2014]